MKKVLLVAVLVLALAVPALAGDYVFVDETPAFSLGPNVYLANIKVKRGPFGGGFLGTDGGWMLYEKNPATLEKKILASGNGRFDGTSIVAMVGGGAMLGGMNIIAATQIKPSNVNANQSQGQGQSQSQSQAQAQAQFQSQKSINVNINKGFIPPGQDK